MQEVKKIPVIKNNAAGKVNRNFINNKIDVLSFYCVSSGYYNILIRIHKWEFMSETEIITQQSHLVKFEDEVTLREPQGDIVSHRVTNFVSLRAAS